MKEVTRDRWRRFGYLCLTFAPLILYAVISIMTAFGVTIVVTVRGVLEGTDNLYTYAIEESLNNSMLTGAIYAVIGIICLGLWYYFGCRRKQLKPPKGVVTPVNLLILAVFAVCMQYVTTYLMMGVDMVLPQVMDKYEQLVELAGLGEVTVMGIVYGVILGPIAEELVFRGVTLFYAQKFTKRFWLANVLQAAAFGVMHMNLVQGLYAFVLGLAMGFIYHSFRSLYATVWLHICFNFLAYGSLEFLNGFLPHNLVFQIIWGLLMCGLAVLLLGLIRKRTSALYYN